MSKNLLHQSASSDALRLKALQSGFESRVEVNQRMLIDKMLARYSSDFVVCRELIQNSDDAKATSFHFEIICDDDNDELISLSEKNFHNKTITEIRAINNGLIFNETDWKRVAAIAEGNTNVESVGQFGVGFFSVFSFSEEPIITSGNEYMAFIWRDDNSLTTYRHELPLEQQSKLTSIILKMRTKYILHTETNLDFDSIIDINENSSNNKSPNRKRQKKSITSITTNDIIPTINLAQLKAYFTKVLSFTKYINELVIKINQKIIFKVTKTRKSISSIKSNVQFKKNSIHNMLHFDSLIQTEQIFSIDHGPSIILNHISVDATLIIDENYHNHIRRILKKSLPSNVQIQLLYTPNNIVMTQQQQRKSSKIDDLHMKILNSLIPLKFQNDEIYPSGLIFIGLGTHQTTGIGMHVYSHLIPTIERENLDLQDPYISKWNRELLLSVGQIIRHVYDQLISTNKQFDSILASYSFQPSVPNNEIGTIIVDGFFSINKDLLVPIKQSPTDINLTLIPSTQAYIANSKHIHSFLTLPLVPYELSKNGLFQALKDRDLINEINNDLIESTIITTILLSNQFVEFLHWLSNQNNNNDKQYIKRLLSIVRFRETNNSSIITLEKLKNYDNFNISTLLPLPSHVLPASVASYLSREELQKQLSLTPLTLKDFLHYYLLKNQLYLFTKENTSTCLLHIISKHSGQLNKTEWNKLKTILSTITCIPTNQGMKIPNESYIPSSILSSDLPIITLNVPQNLTDDDDDDDNNNNNNDEQSIIENIENSVSAEFLKRLGCRTLNVQSFVHARSSLINSNSHTMKTLIQHLMEERDNMSEGDFNALKQSECLRGTTLIPNKDNTRKYAPQDLHFPSVAIQLQWSTLPIIDWYDIDPRSHEYTFLKEIGVREVPDLQKLIDRIIEEHNEQKKKSIQEYKIPIGLKFLAENFQQYYSKLWKTAKIKRAFLPSFSPSKTIILSIPDEVFKDESPLCATLLSDVVQLFEEHFNIALLGIKDRPTLTIAFDILMEKKEEILNIETAPKIFAYMNQLDGLSRPLIERISKLAFIPLEGNENFMKPSQVFIRPDNSITSSRLRQINVIIPTSSDDNDDEITRTSGRRRKRNNAKKTTISKNKKTKTISSTPLLMDDDTDKTGLIDYIDYGSEGNSFLLGIGVLHHPSASILAELLIDRQENYFININQNNSNDLQQKLLAYTSCLRQLAIAAQTTNELQSISLIKRLKTEAWCLGYQILEKRSNNEQRQRLFKIVPPNEIYLDDDHQCAIDLRPLLPPDEPELTKLYEKFGASWLSECVKRTLVHKGKIATSDRGNKLRDLIQYRLDMLFVNNRGEKMENLDEKHIDMLRTTLSVYEVDGIQCQLTFQKKTITLDSTDSSSCALEYDKNKVSLYFQKHIREFDYIDIASELARFVFKKPHDTIVHTISDKLASPLETLKRRGVPVDRLLQHNQQNIRSTISMFQQQSDLNHNNDNYHHHYHESHVEIMNRVDDFNRQHMKDDTKLFSILKKGRAYTQTKFIQQEHVKDEIDHSCEAIPSANMTRYKDLFHSIPLYIERNVIITNKMFDQAKQLAWILIGLANHVFKIPIETLHLYRDIDGARIAFNDRRALFFNLRYYEQVFADKVQPYLQTISPSIPIIHTIVNFYFILTCHELAHNLEMAHNSNFINHLETIAVKFMTEKDLFLEQFSFQNYLQNNLN